MNFLCYIKTQIDMLEMSFLWNISWLMVLSNMKCTLLCDFRAGSSTALLKACLSILILTARWGHVFLISKLDLRQTRAYFFSQQSASGNTHLLFFTQLEMPLDARCNLLPSLSEDMGIENGKKRRCRVMF